MEFKNIDFSNYEICNDTIEQFFQLWEVNESIGLEDKKIINSNQRNKSLIWTYKVYIFI